jgi:hypothetical protein
VVDPYTNKPFVRLYTCKTGVRNPFVVACGWQHTDEFGMPCPTRFPITDVEHKGAEHLDHQPWSLETWNLEQSRSDIARGTPPSLVE